MEVIFSTISQWVNQIHLIRFGDIFDIAIVAVGIYYLIGLIRRTHSTKVFVGVFIILGALWFSGLLQLHTVNYILRNTVQIGMIALVVLFQPEIRRILERIGSGTSLKHLFEPELGHVSEAAITQTVLACSELSATRTGALIIFERDNNLDEQIRTGTILDAEPTAELLKNIFYPKAPLHDGAVIIRNGRIQAGGCMLPLSNNPNLSKDLGMRHRAGIGMSEASDAVVIIVSEETGGISVATNGMLKRHLSKETFEKILRQELVTDETETTKRRLFRFRKGDKDE